jgi:hypothetical protein
MNEQMMLCLPAKARMHENIVGRSNIFRHAEERDRSPLPARFLEERTDWDEFRELNCDLIVDTGNMCTFK